MSSSSSSVVKADAPKVDPLQGLDLPPPPGVGVGNVPIYNEKGELVSGGGGARDADPHGYDPPGDSVVPSSKAFVSPPPLMITTTAKPTEAPWTQPEPLGSSVTFITVEVKSEYLRGIPTAAWNTTPPRKRYPVVTHQQGNIVHRNDPLFVIADHSQSRKGATVSSMATTPLEVVPGFNGLTIEQARRLWYVGVASRDIKAVQAHNKTGQNQESIRTELITAQRTGRAELSTFSPAPIHACDAVAWRLPRCCSSGDSDENRPPVHYKGRPLIAAPELYSVNPATPLEAFTCTARDKTGFLLGLDSKVRYVSIDKLPRAILLAEGVQKNDNNNGDLGQDLAKDLHEGLTGPEAWDTKTNKAFKSRCAKNIASVELMPEFADLTENAGTKLTINILKVAADASTLFANGARLEDVLTLIIDWGRGLLKGAATLKASEDSWKRLMDAHKDKFAAVMAARRRASEAMRKSTALTARQLQLVLLTVSMLSSIAQSSAEDIHGTSRVIGVKVDAPITGAYGQAHIQLH